MSTEESLLKVLLNAKVSANEVGGWRFELPDDALEETKQLILSALPEKKDLTQAARADSLIWGAVMEGYNQALEEVTKALTALFEGEQSK